MLTGFPVSTDGAEPGDDIGALEQMLRECVPDASPQAARSGDVTAGALVAGAAQTLLHPKPTEPPGEERPEAQEAPAKPKRRRPHLGPRARGVLKVAAALLVIAAAAAGGYALSERSRLRRPGPARYGLGRRAHDRGAVRLGDGGLRAHPEAARGRGGARA